MVNIDQTKQITTVYFSTLHTHNCMMFFLWYVVSLFLIINSCTSEQLCIDSCKFDHNFDADLTLPPNCNFTQRDQCDVILTFEYSTRIVNIEFGTLSRKQQRDDIVYTSELISHTTITLDGDSSTENMVEYYCSTGDRCEYNYVVHQLLPLYIHKTCHHFRANLISLLHSDPSSTNRSCLSDSGDVLKCDNPCELVFFHPNLTLRNCDADRNLQFETTVGRTTPTNKPEYDYRLYAYTCTTEMCNGFEMQNKIDKLIETDDGECLIFLQKSSATTTINHEGILYSKSFLLFLLCILILFY
jgi:hypothetical protein